MNERLAQLKARIVSLPTYLLALIIIALLSLLALIVFLLADARSNDGGNSPDRGINTVTLKYGTKPYVAPCSIIPISELERITDGSLTLPGTYALEIHYDTSVPNDRNQLSAASPQSSCSYRTADVDTDKIVRISSAGIMSSQDHKELLAAIEPSRETLATDISALETKLRSSSNTGVTAFLNKIKKDRDEILNYISSDTAAVPVGAVLPNLLMANSVDTQQEIGFILLTKYALIKIELVASDKAKPFDQLSDSELASRLETMSKLVSSAAAHTQDATVSDKDTDGTLGTTKTPWGLRILDPCKVLSDGVFESTFSIKPNDRVFQGVYPYKKDYSLQMERRFGYTANDCSKTYRESYLSEDYTKTSAEEALGQNSYAMIELKIGYMLDAAQAKSALEQSDGVTPSLLPQTNADQAVRYNGQNKSILFTKGSYYFDASLNIRGTSVSEPSDEQLVKFVNAVVAQIK